MGRFFLCFNMSGKQGKEVDGQKKKKKNKSRRRKGNGRTKKLEVENSESAGKGTSSVLSKSTQTEFPTQIELVLDQKIELSKNPTTSSPVPLKLGSPSKPIKNLETNELVHSPDLVLLKKTPKEKGETNFKEETWPKKHYEGTIRLGHGTTEKVKVTDFIGELQRPKREVQRKADTKRRSKVEKKLNLDDSYDVVIESITYV